MIAVYQGSYMGLESSMMEVTGSPENALFREEERRRRGTTPYERLLFFVISSQSIIYPIALPFLTVDSVIVAVRP